MVPRVHHAVRQAGRVRAPCPNSRSTPVQIVVLLSILVQAFSPNHENSKHPHFCMIVQTLPDIVPALILSREAVVKPLVPL